MRTSKTTQTTQQKSKQPFQLLPTQNTSIYSAISILRRQRLTLLYRQEEESIFRVLPPERSSCSEISERRLHSDTRNSIGNNSEHRGTSLQTLHLYRTDPTEYRYFLINRHSFCRLALGIEKLIPLTRREKYSRTRFFRLLSLGRHFQAKETTGRVINQWSLLRRQVIHKKRPEKSQTPRCAPLHPKQATV